MNFMKFSDIVLTEQFTPAGTPNREFIQQEITRWLTKELSYMTDRPPYHNVKRLRL